MSQPRSRPPTSNSAGIGPVQIPVAARLGVPAVIAGGQDGVTTDRALSALLITVENIDGERMSFLESFQKTATNGIVGVPDGGLPVSGAACGDIEVDCEPAKLLSLHV